MILSLPEPPITSSISEAGVAVVEQRVGDVAGRSSGRYAPRLASCAVEAVVQPPGLQVYLERLVV